MCGITGAVSLVRAHIDASMVQRMTDRILHRGPDGGGIWQSIEGTVCLGHRRLSIIDTSNAAAQPMVLDEGNYIIVFNGEVYNFREIRQGLEKAGYKFVSTSDTEVVLRAYEEYGESCVDRFNGMWALSIFDAKKRKVFLSRDRIGIKPLYFFKTPGLFLFASEIKAIIASGLYSPDVDLAGLNEYFTFQNIISNRTLFKDIAMVPPATNVTISLDDGRILWNSYWDMRYEPDDSLTEEDVEGSLIAAFENSMRRHLISDVEIGATISGGMDSSAIIAIASQQIRGINTFTGYFDTSKIDAEDRSVSEKDDARIIAQRFSTKHHERLIGPQDVVTTLPSIIWHLEDPKVGMCYTFFLMSQLVSNYVTVNLSGTGGDELFAGYPWRYSLIDGLFEPEKFDQAYFGWWNRLTTAQEKKDLFANSIYSQIDPQDPFIQYRKVIGPADGFSPVNRALYFDLKTFLHGFLMVEDKMGMAFSIESRFPFLDMELIELLRKMPDGMKYKNGVAKYALKRAFSKLLPEETLYKRKQGFTPPDRSWYKNDIQGYIHSTLCEKRSIINEFITKEYISSVLSRHESGGDLRLMIWSLLFFEGWCRTFLTGTQFNGIKVF